MVIGLTQKFPQNTDRHLKNIQVRKSLRKYWPNTRKIISPLFFKEKRGWIVVTHAFTPSSLEAETGVSL